ncbi:tRNA glutamyl-Q(34) synthetase GluQRS [Martelella sp. AMO21009]
MKPDQDRPVFRFAPSPNGYLHLGHALSAFENQRRAEAAGGRLLLRIEDIDQTRATPELEAALIEDLDWLGIAFEPPVFRQSEHFADYQAMLDRLIVAGLAYPAFMTRGEVRRQVEAFEADGSDWPRDPDGAPLYPAADRLRGEEERQALLASGRRHAWRLDMEAAVARIGKPLCWREERDGGIVDIPADPAVWGDVVLSRSDAPSSYHLSVVTDDAAQGITHVVRGLDLYHATAIHRLLQELLGLPAPVYHHHRLILGPDGRKLSKSNGDTALRQLRAEGRSVADIRILCGI